MADRGELKLSIEDGGWRSGVEEKSKNNKGIEKRAIGKQGSDK
jgi:hypothetical protein